MAELDRAALIAWAKEQEMAARDAALVWCVSRSDYMSYADHFAAIVARLEATCTLTEGTDGDYWESSCGHCTVWEDGPPSLHGYDYCGHCGARAVEVRWVEPPFDPDADDAKTEGRQESVRPQRLLTLRLVLGLIGEDK